MINEHFSEKMNDVDLHLDFQKGDFSRSVVFDFPFFSKTRLPKATYCTTLHSLAMLLLPHKFEPSD